MDLTPLRRAATLILMAPLLVTASATRAQSPSPAAREVPTFGTSTELVYVRFHVERKGGYLDTLRPDQIRVLEDGQPQKVVLLETPATRERTVPPEVTLALDVSSSVMDDRLLDESLLKEVLFATLGEQARIGLCAFGGQLRCLTPPSSSAASSGGRERASTPPWPTWPSRLRTARRRSAPSSCSRTDSTTRTARWARPWMPPSPPTCGSTRSR